MDFLCSFKVMPSEAGLHGITLLARPVAFYLVLQNLKIPHVKQVSRTKVLKKSLLNIAIVFHIHFISAGACWEPEAETDTQISVNHLYYSQTVSKLNAKQNNSEIDFFIYFTDQSLQRK